MASSRNAAVVFSQLVGGGDQQATRKASEVMTGQLSVEQAATEIQKHVRGYQVRKKKGLLSFFRRSDSPDTPEPPNKTAVPKRYTSGSLTRQRAERLISTVEVKIIQNLVSQKDAQHFYPIEIGSPSDEIKVATVDEHKRKAPVQDKAPKGSAAPQSSSSSDTPSLNSASSAGSTTQPLSPLTNLDALKVPPIAASGLVRQPSFRCQHMILKKPTPYVWDLFEKGSLIGVPGAYGSVYRAKEQATKTDYVVKTILKRGRDQHEIESFAREIELMRQMNHTNVIGFHQALETQDELHIVMDICTGGDLIDEIEAKARARGHSMYSELDASRILRDVLEGLQYMHSLKVGHFDLKPDNLVYASRQKDAPIKIIDLGMARFWNAKDREHFTQNCGTLYYSAPEVISRKYNLAADMWSIGVILYVLLIGYPPFYEDKSPYEKNFGKQGEQEWRKVVQKKILRGFQPVIKEGYGPWFPEKRPISESARDLISKLLVPDVAKRLTAKEALRHPWILGTDASETPLSPLVLRSLKSFGAKCKFQQKALALMVEILSDDEVDEIKQTYENFDVDSDGVISMDDFYRAVSTMLSATDSSEFHKKAMSAPIRLVPGGPPIARFESSRLYLQELTEIFKNVDVNNDGFISYHEMLLACVQMKVVAKEERMREMFRKFDKHNSNKITVKHIVEALRIDEEEAQELLSEADKNMNNEVDYEEFLDMWRANCRREPSSF